MVLVSPGPRWLHFAPGPVPVSETPPGEPARRPGTAGQASRKSQPERCRHSAMAIRAGTCGAEAAAGQRARRVDPHLGAAVCRASARVTGGIQPRRVSPSGAVPAGWHPHPARRARGDLPPRAARHAGWAGTGRPQADFGTLLPYVAKPARDPPPPGRPWRRGRKTAISPATMATSTRSLRRRSGLRSRRASGERRSPLRSPGCCARSAVSVPAQGAGAATASASWAAPGGVPVAVSLSAASHTRPQDRWLVHCRGLERVRRSVSTASMKLRHPLWRVTVTGPSGIRQAGARQRTTTS